MRETLRDLSDKLAIGRELGAYDSETWAVFDDEKNMSCTAEVMMNADCDEMEADIQVMRDFPKGDEKPMEQVFHLKAKPATGGKWDVVSAIIMGEDKAEGSYNWFGKAAEFFHACVQELQMEKIPDFDEIAKKTLKDDERFGGKRGGGGRKSPKIKPQNLMSMKGGM